MNSFEKSQISKKVKADWALLAKASVIIGVTIALFYQDLSMIFSDALQNEATSYAVIIPFLLVYIVYRKRKMIRAVAGADSSRLFQKIPLNAAIGIPLMLASFLLYWYGSYTFTPLEYHIMALPIFVSACLLLLFNTSILRQLAFPTVFLFLLVPPPEEILYNLGTMLASLSSDLAYNLTKLLGYPVTSGLEDGVPVIHLTQQNGIPTTFSVDVACSGIYSQIGFFVFALFIAFIIRDKIWKKASIFALGLPLVYMLNVVRIGTIIGLGYYYGMELAMNAFHILGGWALVFVGTLALLLVSEKAFRVHLFGSQAKQCPQCRTGKTIADTCERCGRILSTAAQRLRAKDLANILSLVLIVVLILSIQAPVFALTQGPSIIVTNPSGSTVSTSILPNITGYNKYFYVRDTDFEKKAKQDFSLLYYYAPINTSKDIVWTAIEIASTRIVLHRWETCLITWPIAHGSQPGVEQIDLRDVTLVDNPPIVGRYFVFRRVATNATQVVLYWYETATFSVNSTLMRKYVKFSLEILPASLGNLPALENDLLTIAEEITAYWQPIKAWSQIALTISKYGDKLIVVTMTIVGAVIVLYALSSRNEKRRNAVAYSKLSEPTKRVVTSIWNTQNNALPTLGNISATCTRETGTQIDPEGFYRSLSSIHELGVIRKEISNNNDEPYLVWKINTTVKQLEF